MSLDFRKNTSTERRGIQLGTGTRENEKRIKKPQQSYIPNEDGYFDTGKKYGDYFYENYEQYKDMPIYGKDNKFYLYTNNTYQDLGKLDTTGNVILGDTLSTEELENEKLERAKSLGFKENKDLEVYTKEYDKAKQLFDVVKKEYNLNDEEFEQFKKTGEIPKNRQNILNQSVKGNAARVLAKDYIDVFNNKEKETSVLKGESIRDRLIKDADLKETAYHLTPSEHLFLETSGMSDFEKENFKKFLAGEKPTSITENSSYIKGSDLWSDGWQPGDIINTMGSTLNVIGADLISGIGSWVESGADFLTNITGSLLSGVFGGSGKSDVTKELNGNKVTQYKWGNQTFWYDKDNNKLYDNNGVEMPYFNIENLIKVQEYNNGIAEFGQYLRNEANATNEMENAILGNSLVKKLRDQSVVGSKTESLVQSLGQTLPTMGLGIAGVNASTTAGVIFGTSYGSTKARLIQQGYSENEARTRAFIDAAAETISEQFFEGIPGIRTANWGENLVSNLTKGASKYLGTRAGKIVSKLLPVLGEGFEEIISNSLVAAQNDILAGFFPEYNLNEGQSGNILQDMVAELVSADSWDQFMGAIITSAILNGGSAIINTKTRNELIKAYAEDNNITFDEAKMDLSLIDTGTEFEPAIINKISDEYVDFNGTRLNSEDILNRAKRYLALSQTITDEQSLNKLQNAINNLSDAYELLKQKMPEEQMEQPEQKEQKKSEIKEIKTEQSEEVIKDAQKEQEQLNNTLQENKIKLEKLKSNQSQNKEQIDKLEQELKNLRTEKTEEVDKKTLEKQISKQRLAIEQLEAQIKSEEAQFGVTDEITQLNLRLLGANNHLDNLLEQQKQLKQTSYNEKTNDRINEIKKQLAELKTIDHAQEINQLEQEIETMTSKKIFNRYQPNIKNMSDDFDYNTSTASHDTGFGISLTTSDKYIKGKERSDIIQTPLQTNKGFLLANDNIVNNQNIDMLNDIMNKYMPDMPNIFTYGMTNTQLINAINTASNLVANANDNQTGRKAWVEMYNAINKDGYIKEYDNGEMEASVVSTKNLTNFESNLESLSADEIGADMEYSNAYDLNEDTLEIGDTTVRVLDEMPKDLQKKAEQINSLWDTTRNNLKKLKSKFVNSWDIIQEIGKKAKKRTLVARFNNIYNAGGQAQFAIQHEQTNFKGEKIGDGITKIFDRIDAKRGNLSVKEYRQILGDYIYASRQATQADDRIPIIGDEQSLARIKEINTEIDDLSKEIGNKNKIDQLTNEKRQLTRELITAAQNAVKEIESKYPEMKIFKQDILKYETNLRSLLKEAGFINEEQEQLMNQMYSEYVRVYRDVKRRSSNESKQSDTTSINSPIKSTKGSTAPLIPLEEALAKHTVEVYKACARNMFAKELYDTIGGVNSKIRKEAVKNGIVNFTNGKQALIFYDKGQQKAIPINNEIAELINPDLTQFGLIGKILETESKLTRDLITNFSPLFAIGNMVTDLGDAPINSQHSLLYVKNYLPAWYHMITNSEKWQQYVALGGLVTTYFDYDKGFRQKNIATKALGTIPNAIEFLGERLEHVTRFAEFLASIEAGDSIVEAMYNANEVTVNFKKGGTITKKASRLGFNYLNAKILGVYKLFENIADHKGGKAALKLATKAAFLSIAPAILNEILMGDDDEYQQLTDDVKNKNYIFRIGGKLIKLPKGRLSRIVSSGPRRLLQGINEGESFEKAFSKSIKEVPDFAANELDLTTLALWESHSLWPLFNLVLNKDNAKNYFGNLIVPQRYQNDNSTLKDQWEDPSVTGISVKLSKWAKETFGWNISPFQLDYLADQKLGFVWDLAEPLMTKEPDKMAWETKFTADARTSNKYVNELYELTEKKATNEDDKILKKYYSSIQKQTWDLYAEIRNVGKDKTLSMSEKEQKINAIRDNINKLAKDAIEMGKKPVKNKTYQGTKYKQVGLEYLYKYDEKENTWTKVNPKYNEYETVIKKETN